jgi:hypothetical protein
LSQRSAENILESCRYFLRQIQETSDNQKINNYYLSLKNSASIKTQSNEADFRQAAKELRNNSALKFIRWWTNERNNLSGNELYSKRIDSPIILLPNPPSKGFSLRYYAERKKRETNRNILIADCQEGLALIEKIVSKADLFFIDKLEVTNFGKKKH